MHSVDDFSLEISSPPGEDDVLTVSHETFPFAGKFGRRATGTAIGLRGDEIVAALSFSPDRTDETCCRIRFLAVRRDRQREGLATTLVREFTAWALSEGYETVRISIDSPFAAVAVARAGFVFTGDTAPRGEVVFRYPGNGELTLEAALRCLLERPLSVEQEHFIRARLEE